MGTLIDDSSNRWNDVLVRQIFSEDMDFVVPNTLLVDRVPNDRMVCKTEKNGLYYVISAYMLCIEELVDTSHLRRPSF